MELSKYANNDRLRRHSRKDDDSMSTSTHPSSLCSLSPVRIARCWIEVESLERNFSKKKLSKDL